MISCSSFRGWPGFITGLALVLQATAAELPVVAPETAGMSSVKLKQVDAVVNMGRMGIELDDRSHERPERKARDELVEGVFSAAGLPLLRVPVRQGYAPAELVALIQPFFGAPSKTTPAPAVVASQPPAATSEPLCPKCGAAMALRTSKSGTNSGGQFWGCTNYPKCRGTMPRGD